MILILEVSKPLVKKPQYNNDKIICCLTWLWFRIGFMKIPFKTIYIGTYVELENNRELM